jgi:pyruvate,orthophosphate dikinase
MKKYVYLFSEGNKDMRELLGGKGANLAEMTNLGLPVPKGFTITTEACLKYYKDNKKLSIEIQKEINDKINKLEHQTNKKFGDLCNPLLVSVRSGARASMPGMMDTILNLGLNDNVAESYAKITNNPRFVYDSYRRLIEMYADVVKGLPREDFEEIITKRKKKKNVLMDIDLDSDDMIYITKEFKKLYYTLAKQEFPQNPKLQLIEAIKAVFRSWNNDRAIYYRKMNNIPDSWGTAVNVQVMVYGNLKDNSGTGVAFSRNPSTGENKLYGEYLMNAQGEDVVAGIRTPSPIAKLKDDMPNVYNEFYRISKKLENHYKDMQDMEFTIEDGKLYLLQTRNGKRTGYAAVKIAVDLAKEGKITKKEAIKRIEPNDLNQLLHPMFDLNVLSKAKVIAEGLAASPGAASGKIYFNATDIKKYSKDFKTILVRKETSPEDIEGMHFADGILTERGGMTSHAAVVARGMGKCCVSGVDSIIINEKNKTILTSTGKILHEGDELSLDGSTGKVYLGSIKTTEPTLNSDFETLLKWADKYRNLDIRCNADTPKDALTARKFGAEGIGLCRTEHMFFEEKRIFYFRCMIASDSKEEREKYLNKILPYQEKDFMELYKVMAPYPVVIRYLDPPLHEFLPKTEDEINKISTELNISSKKFKERIDNLKEFNPMMGHRGCRLLITYPEIAVMQTKAVINAAIKVTKDGYKIKPEIMIPLIGSKEELIYIKNIVCQTADKLIKENNVKLKYHIGTMIEIPRAALLSAQIASEAEFFSFGTNDLTQMTYGFSRDDAGKFLDDYYDKKIFVSDPFKSIDEDGVGSLMKIAIKNGRMIRPNISLGICGEHGGDPKSIAFCESLGLDYVSCSPYRVPIARLAAAKAAIKAGIEKKN